MNTRRLRTLAKFLRTVVPREKFNISTWSGFIMPSRPDCSCNTVACALGWATVIPSFKRAGLHLRRSQDGFIRPWFKGHTDYRAASKFFGITDSDSEWLFSSIHYPASVTPKGVARRIEAFIKDH